MSDHLIRAMLTADLPAVAQLDLAAFNVAASRAGNPPYPGARHQMGLQYFLRTAPDLCLVAEDQTGITGYLFGHRWGRTNWTGPLGVEPARMGRGLGTALIEEFKARAAGGGATTIGLETSIGHNVRMYERRGFVSCGLTIRASRELRPLGSAPVVPDPGGLAIANWRDLGPADRSHLIGQAGTLAELVSPGLDHAAEMSAVPDSGIGETLVALDASGRLAGYALVHVKAYRSTGPDDAPPPADPLVWALLGWPAALPCLLAGCQAAAAAVGAERLRVSCHSSQPQAWIIAKEAGFRIEAAFARMVAGGGYFSSGSPAWGRAPLDMSTWLG